MRAGATILVIAAVALPRLAPAQVSLVMPDSGTRMELQTSSVVGRTATGALAQSNQAFVSLALGRDGSYLSVPWSRISVVNMHGGRDAKTGAVRGALVAIAATTVVYPALSSWTRDRGLSSQARFNVAVFSFGVLPVAAGVVGGLRGPDRWIPVIWRPSEDPVLTEGEATRLRLMPGSDVRVRHGRRWLHGRLIGMTDDSVAMQVGAGRTIVAWRDITALSRRDGRNRWRGAAYGFSLASAFAIGRLLNDDRTSTVDKQRLMAQWMLGGIATGAVIGVPRWTRVPYPAR